MLRQMASSPETHKRPTHGRAGEGHLDFQVAFPGVLRPRSLSEDSFLETKTAT